MEKGQGRGSAVNGRGFVHVAALVIVLVLISQLETSEAAVFNVGDSTGWTFNVQNWPQGKHFKPGDVLRFSYVPSYHNVVVVDKRGYDNCRAPAGAKVYTSGNDQIKLGKGYNYFICSFTGHCESQMKIAVNAL